MRRNGTVIAGIQANAAEDANGATGPPEPAQAEVEYQGAPTVVVAADARDPADEGPVSFTATFSKDVTGLTEGELIFGGSAQPTGASFSGGPRIYTISVDGMQRNGTVIGGIQADAVQDVNGASGPPEPAQAEVDYQGAPPPSGISISDASLGEPASGRTPSMRFDISIPAPASSAVTVRWSTEDETATAGEDYTARVNRSARIPAGQTTVTVAVPLVGDGVDEADETFRVVLSSPVGAPLADPVGVGTIVDDDPPPALSVEDAAIDEGARGSQPLAFTVRLSQPATRRVRVDWSTSDGTATASDDYTARSRTVAIPVGETTATVAVPVRGDRLAEDDETFTVTLSNPLEATIADGEATGTIRNDD
jgi:chitinase